MGTSIERYKRRVERIPEDRVEIVEHQGDLFVQAEGRPGGNGYYEWTFDFGFYDKATEAARDSLSEAFEEAFEKMIRDLYGRRWRRP